MQTGIRSHEIPIVLPSSDALALRSVSYCRSSALIKDIKLSLELCGVLDATRAIEIWIIIMSLLPVHHRGHEVDYGTKLDDLGINDQYKKK